nr:HXXEE domain-containing protein [uncultured Mogibacterium sp.]
MKSVAWLFPVIFILHEMEEIIGLRIWLDKNTDIINKYNKFSAVYKKL